MCYCKSLTPSLRFVRVTYGTLFSQFSPTQSSNSCNCHSRCLLSRKTYFSRVKSCRPPVKPRLRHPFTQSGSAVQRETVSLLFRTTQQCNSTVSEFLTSSDKLIGREFVNSTVVGVSILLPPCGIRIESFNKGSCFDKLPRVTHCSNSELNLLDLLNITCGYNTQFSYGSTRASVLPRNNVALFDSHIKRKRVPSIAESRQLQNYSVPYNQVRYFRHCHFSIKMAKSKFEYVRQFEVDDPCLQNCWLVVRIDGKAFHKFTDIHHFMKPNDERGLSLMTRAAQTVMSEFNEIVLAYGQSDEYSFVFHKNCKLYNRRASKIMTNVVSLFSSSFTLYWARFFNSQELQYPPSFDGRVVLYPSDENLKDYLSWRQADCHINNLYNTCFWKLVQDKGLTPNRAAERLKGTLSSDKNELLFSEFSINYNNLPELFRKGTVLIRPKIGERGSPSPERAINNHSMRSHESKASKKPGSIILHTDIIGKKFWEDNPHILSPKM